MSVPTLRHIFHVLFATLVASQSACAILMPAGSKGSGNVSGTAHRISVQGALENESLRESVGATITVYRVDPSGSLTPLSNHAAVTDEEGRFAVAVDVPNGPPVDLLVRADSEFGYGLVVVPTDMVVEKSVPAQPITDATTVEAHVYLAAKAAGIWPADQGVSRLHGLISAPLAAKILRDADYAAEVGALSEAASAAASTWQLALEDPSVGVKDTQLKRVYTAMDWSLFTRDEALVHTADAATTEKVEADFALSGPLAYGLARVRPLQLSVAAQATAESLDVYARRLHGGARAQALADAALLRASYVTEAVFEAVYQAGTAQQRDAVRCANEVLNRQLAHAAEDPAAAEAKLHAAWAHYRAQVTDVLRGVTTPGVSFDRVEAAMEPIAAAAADALGDLRDEDGPAETARMASHALTQLYARTDAQATALTQKPSGPEHNLTRALLAAVGNLAVAAR